MGRILSTTGTGANTIGVYNPFRYRGYYYDNETGFYYLNSRYYDPSSGRFLNADGQLNDVLLGYNLFAYCENNPIMWYDPYGYAVESLISDEQLFGSSFRPSLLGAGGSLFSTSYIYHDIYHTEINPTYDAWSRMQAYDEWFWSSGLNFNSTLYNPAHNRRSSELSNSELKTFGVKGNNSGFRVVNGSHKDAMNFVMSQTHGLSEYAPGKFVGYNSSGVEFRVFPKVMDGYTSIRIYGVEGLKGIKYIW